MEGMEGCRQDIREISGRQDNMEGCRQDIREISGREGLKLPEMIIKGKGQRVHKMLRGVIMGGDEGTWKDVDRKSQKYLVEKN